jgi:hypothetical protein
MWPDGLDEPWPTIASTLVLAASRATSADSERPCGDALVVAKHSEQDVLRPDVVVVEEARLLLGEDHCPACRVGEAFEHTGIVPEPAFLRRPQTGIRGPQEIFTPIARGLDGRAGTVDG